MKLPKQSAPVKRLSISTTMSSQTNQNGVEASATGIWEILLGSK
jgi:hypothetical protein